MTSADLLRGVSTEELRVMADTLETCFRSRDLHGDAIWEGSAHHMGQAALSLLADWRDPALSTEKRDAARIALAGGSP